MWDQVAANASSVFVCMFVREGKRLDVGLCVCGGREQSAYAVTKHTQKDKQIMIHNVYVYLVMADTVSKAVPYVMIYNCLSYIMIYNVLYYDI